jgi:hypothetical protein
MRGLTRVLAVVWIVLALPDVLPAQFTSEALAQREPWEEFLRTAKIIESRQLSSDEGITQPWILTLEKDGIVHKAVWKDVEGLVHGFEEHWYWEIAAYRLDKYLGLNMVPPTVERRFWRRMGSLQLWVESRMSLREKNQNGIEIPPQRLHEWHRGMCKQRTFDNLIANEDRHQGNYLITDDWRIILIDHSRTFRTRKEFSDTLIYCETHPSGPLIMREVPRELYDRLKALDEKTLKRVTGKYLTGKEREAVMGRRDLIIEEIDRLQGMYGNVLY